MEEYEKAELPTGWRKVHVRRNNVTEVARGEVMSAIL